MAPTERGGSEMHTSAPYLVDLNTGEKVQLNQGPAALLSCETWVGLDKASNRLINLHVTKTPALELTYIYNIFEDINNPAPVSQGFCSNWRDDVF